MSDKRDDQEREAEFFSLISEALGVLGRRVPQTTWEVDREERGVTSTSRLDPRQLFMSDEIGDGDELLAEVARNQGEISSEVRDRMRGDRAAAERDEGE